MMYDVRCTKLFKVLHINDFRTPYIVHRTHTQLSKINFLNSHIKCYFDTNIIFACQIVGLVNSQNMHNCLAAQI
jgi:hypothetical protein